MAPASSGTSSATASAQVADDSVSATASTEEAGDPSSAVSEAGPDDADSEETDALELGDTAAQQQGIRLTLIRHGESVVTVDQVIGGPLTCSGLSPLGQRQAAALRDRLTEGHEPVVDELWASTMPRAIQTAEAINETLGLELRIDRDLEERRPGEADGTPWIEFGDRWEYDHNDPFAPLSPGGESSAEFTYRVSDALQKVVDGAAQRATDAGDGPLVESGAQPRERHVMIVCHGGVVDVAFRHLLHTPDRGVFHLWTLNTSITEFRTRDLTHPRMWQLVRYNDTAHLAGLPPRTA